MKLEDIVDPCLHKKLSLDKDGTTFKDVKEGHKLDKCNDCPGTPGSCPNYADYYKLKEKQGYKLI